MNLKTFAARKFVVIGGGNREAALAMRLAEEGCNVVMYPLNGAHAVADGLITGARPETVGILDPLTFCLDVSGSDGQGLACVIIGSEAYLQGTLVEQLMIHRIPVFAPSRQNAELEISKMFLYDLMEHFGFMPETHAFRDPNYLKNMAFRMLESEGAAVIKLDGLSGARGVKVCKTKDDIVNFVDFCFSMINGGQWKGPVLLQEPVQDGEDISYHVLVGRPSASGIQSLVECPITRDHKIAPSGIMGGGSGVISPVAGFTRANMNRMRGIANTILDIMSHRATYPFVGCLFLGFMKDKNGKIWLTEANVRMGDPEILAILALLKTPLHEVLYYLMHGKQGRSLKVRWNQKEKVGVWVLSVPGYPNNTSEAYGEYVNGIEVLLDAHPEVQFVPGGMFAPNYNHDMRLISGRAAALVACGTTWEGIRDSLTSAANMLSFSSGSHLQRFEFLADMFDPYI